MTQDLNLVIRFKDIDHDDAVQDHLERRIRHISEEFPEANHYELSLSLDADKVQAHAHVAGRRIDLASHATASAVRTAGEVALDKLERELRRKHDKSIFSQRRTARRASTKRAVVG